MSLLPRLLAILALLGQIVVSIGILVPVAAAKASSLPYPCQGRKCGCRTSEACWAGACCCFTMKEKLAWAEANGVDAPAHSHAIAAFEEKPMEEEHDCCAKAKACCPPKAPANDAIHCNASTKNDNKPKTELQAMKFQWLTIVDVQGCHGKPADALGVMTMPPAVLGKYTVLRADTPPAFDWLSPFDVSVDSPSADISSPPPKLD